METSKYLEYRDYEWAVKFNRIALTLIGLWPEPNQTTQERFMCNLRALLTFLIILNIILIPSIHSLTRIYGDIMLMIDNLQFTLPLITILIRIAVFWWKKQAVTLLIDMVASDWTKPKTSWEKFIMITRAQTARVITMSMYSMTAASLFFGIIAPLCGLSMRYVTNVTDPGKPLPLQTYYIYDITESPRYEVTYVMQSISLLICGIPYTSIDNFLSLMVFHICGQLDVLRDRITNLDKFENYANALKNCIRNHMRLLRAIIFIDDTFNIMLFALFLYFGIIFSLYGFLLLNLLEDGNSLTISRVIFLMSIIVNVLCHTCIYCAIGEILTTQYNRIHYAAYSNEWYSLNARNARNIFLIMIRSSEPIYLTAGRMFPMTMSTFCNVDFEWAVRLNRYSLKLIGLWPESEQCWQRRLKCNLRALFVFLSVLITCIIPSLHSLIRIRKDIVLLIDNLQFTLPVMASTLKLAVFWWKVKGTVLVLKMVANDWTTSRTERERSTMIEKARLARFIIACAYVIMLVSITLAVILPACGFSMRYLSNITDPGRPMPMQTYYIYDVTKSPQYELTYLSQSISMCMCIMPYTGIDNFLGLMVLHICGQLDILKGRLANLDKFTDFRGVLKACVMDHTRLLRAICVIEDTFNLMLLILFLYFGVLFALYGFLGITLFREGRNLSFGRTAFLVTMIVNTFAHMCLYCAVGEILIARCDDIHHAVYNHNWYTLDPKNSRTLILLMVRSSKPVYITAGKVFPMTMSTFCNLLKTSAGYISVLLATIS